MEKIIEKIEQTHERLKYYIPQRKRLIFKKIDIKNKKAIIIYGARGVGKTTFLLSNTLNKNILYFSADNINYSDIPLYDLVEAIFKYGYDGVAIDEIHFARDWEKSLKSLYDDYPDKKIWISDSSNIILKKSVFDLSRRFAQVHLPLLSFREYIHLKTGIAFEKVDPLNLKNVKDKFIKEIIHTKNSFNILKLFKEYLKSGTRPFFLEGDFCEKLGNLIDKSIYYDIPFYAGSIKEIHLRLLKTIISFLLKSKIPKINISSMCRDWEIGKEKLYKLLDIMESAELISIIKKKNNKRIYSKGEKIFLSDPAFYFCFDGDTGNGRESFIITMLKDSYKIFSSMDEKQYDFLISDSKRDYKIEVGGKRKNIKGADFVISDDIEFPAGKRIPLWLIGFIY